MTLLSGGGALQHPDMVSPVKARRMVRTETAQIAPPMTSNIGSPAIGLTTIRYESPPQVNVLNAASPMKPEEQKNPSQNCYYLGTIKRRGTQN